MPTTIEQINAMVAELRLQTETGIANSEAHALYVEKSQMLIEAIAKELMDSRTLALNQTAMFEKTVAELRMNVKADPKTLDDKGINELFGRALRSIWRKDFVALGNMGLIPNDKDINWVNPEGFEWSVDVKEQGKPGWNSKALTGDPLTGTNTGQFLLPTPLSDVILKNMVYRSRMASLVTPVPMATDQMSFPNDNSNIKPTWGGYDYGYETGEGKLVMGTPTLLRAQTLSIFYAWLDEYLDASVGDLGAIMREHFITEWAREIDSQILTANASPFTGLLYADQVVHIIGSSTPYGLNYTDLTTAISRVMEEEKTDAMWFMNETIAHQVRSILDPNGNPVYYPPNGEGAPGRLLGYPVMSISVMPSASAVGPAERFIWFGNPRKGRRGFRRGMEVRIYSETLQGMTHSESFTRFRVREGYVTSRTAERPNGGTCVAIQTAPTP